MTVWGAFPDYIEEQRRTRRNEKFLKGVVLPDALKLTADREEAVKGAEIVVLAPPSKFFASVMEGFRGLITDDQLVVSLTKGLCESSNKRMTELAKEILGIKSVVALAGPTHAEEVSRGIPTTIVAACEDEEKAKKGLIGLVGRGFTTVIRPEFRDPSAVADCAECRMCVDACPTGALRLLAK